MQIHGTGNGEVPPSLATGRSFISGSQGGGAYNQNVGNNGGLGGHGMVVIVYEGTSSGGGQFIMPPDGDREVIDGELQV